jgi:hypothetical protein
MASLTASWHSAKVVRTRDKISFFIGVMSLLISALLFGMAPEYVDPRRVQESPEYFFLQMGAYIIHGPSIIPLTLPGI